MCEENLDVSHLHMTQENKTVVVHACKFRPCGQDRLFKLKAKPGLQSKTLLRLLPVPSLQISTELSGILRMNAIRLFQQHKNYRVIWLYRQNTEDLSCCPYTKFSMCKTVFKWLLMGSFTLLAKAFATYSFLFFLKKMKLYDLILALIAKTFFSFLCRDEFIICLLLIFIQKAKSKHENSCVPWPSFSFGRKFILKRRWYGVSFKSR